MGHEFVGHVLEVGAAVRDLAALNTHCVVLADGPGAYALFDAKRDGCIKVALVP